MALAGFKGTVGKREIALFTPVVLSHLALLWTGISLQAFAGATVPAEL